MNGSFFSQDEALLHASPPRSPEAASEASSVTEYSTAEVALDASVSADLTEPPAPRRPPKHSVSYYRPSLRRRPTTPPVTSLPARPHATRARRAPIMLPPIMPPNVSAALPTIPPSATQQGQQTQIVTAPPSPAKDETILAALVETAQGTWHTWFDRRDLEGEPLGWFVLRRVVAVIIVFVLVAALCTACTQLAQRIAPIPSATPHRHFQQVGTRSLTSIPTTLQRANLWSEERKGATNRMPPAQPNDTSGDAPDLGTTIAGVNAAASDDTVSSLTIQLEQEPSTKNSTSPATEATP